MNIEKNLDRLERQNAERPLALEQLRRIRENYRTILSDLRMIQSMTVPQPVLKEASHERC